METREQFLPSLQGRWCSSRSVRSRLLSCTSSHESVEASDDTVPVKNNHRETKSRSICKIASFTPPNHGSFPVSQITNFSAQQFPKWVPWWPSVPKIPGNATCSSQAIVGNHPVLPTREDTTSTHIQKCQGPLQAFLRNSSSFVYSTIASSPPLTGSLPRHSVPSPWIPQKQRWPGTKKGFPDVLKNNYFLYQRKQGVIRSRKTDQRRANQHPSMEKGYQESPILTKELLVSDDDFWGGGYWFFSRM